MKVSAIVHLMQNVARKAGRSLARDFNEVEHLQVSKKGPSDFVSVADKKAEDIIKYELSLARPDYTFVGEETGITGDATAEHMFIVDPLDGTTNFLHAIPHFAVSIAYVYQGEIQAGVIYDPIKNEMFSAEKGGGAILNDTRLRVSKRDMVSECLVATGIPFKGCNEDRHQDYTKKLMAVMQNTCGARRMGAAALDLAYVAAGRCEAYFEYGCCAWDLAAGLIIVTEAGGLVVNETNRPYALDGYGFQKQWILASNNTSQRAMYKMLFTG